MRCDVNSDWKRMLLAIILDYCEGSVSILVGKLKIKYICDSVKYFI